MDKNVLLINDLAGYGKVALSVMIPVMSHMGVSVHNLPTALVSNTLDYGKFQILDTTEYMKDTLRIWKELEFKFDAVSVGFIVNEEQARLVTDLCCEQRDKGIPVICDPIMGDDGHLYPGMGENTVKYMKGLVSCADYVLPNYTEASFLTGASYEEDPSPEQVRRIIDDLRKLGARSVVITSVCIGGQHQVCCYDHRADCYFNLPFDLIPVRFPGTGDIFSSVLLGGIMKEEPLMHSVARAMNTVYSMIASNADRSDKFRGIDIETCLEEIRQ